MIAGCCRCPILDAKPNPSVSEAGKYVLPSLVKPLQNDSRCVEWVDSVLNGLSLRERIGQLFVYTIAPQTDKANRELLRKVVEDYKVGGLLFSGGTLQNQALLTNEAQQMADTPLMITFDGEWGLSMRLKNTPVFPRNMVLGCIQDEALLYEYGREMARQCREMGVQVNFAPVADVNVNPKNPVIGSRSFGESPHNVARKVTAYARGLEEGGVLSVCKHFPGHGDTDVDSHKALPKLAFSRERMDSVELYPFKAAIREGLGGIMVGHLEVPALERRAGLPSSLSRRVVHDLLKDELKFRGLVFTDALVMKGVSGNGSICLKALKAGNDLLLVPRGLKEEVAAVLAAVKRNELTEQEITEKCRKVLTYKYALGLSRKPSIVLPGLETRINTPYASDLIRRLNYAAVTVLGNARGTLPLDSAGKDIAVLHVGASAGLQPFVEQLSMHVRSTEYRLGKETTEARRRALKTKLAEHKRIVVGITESNLSPYRSFFATFAPNAEVIYVFFTPAKQMLQLRLALPSAEAVMLAHTSDADVQRQAARVLCGSAVATGRLSAAVGNLFASGEGVELNFPSKPYRFPETTGVNADLLARIDTIVQEGIREDAYPGCQVVILKEGREVYNKAFGTYAGENARGGKTRFVTTESVYDVASLTKTSATLLAVMKLYDKGLLNLTDRLSDHLPYLKGTDKRHIIVKELLFHQSGLPSTLLFYQDAIDGESYSGTLFKARADRQHSARIGRQTWANPNFRFRAGLMSKVRTNECTLQVCDSLWLNRSFKKDYLQKIIDAPLREKRYRYSCVGFILLQQLVEARAGMALDEFLQKEFYTPMGLKRTGYLPLRFLPKEEIVPSSVDPFLRKSTLQGFVHDESAAFQGGVSGNAGLFSTAEELARIYQMLLNGGELDGRRYLGKETCRLFTTTTARNCRRGLGFDRPDTRNPEKSPCAPSTPASVFGHTGFTGGCAWADPDNGLVFVFLSNRIYPDSWNTKLMKLDIRGKIQEAMYSALERM